MADEPRKTETTPKGLTVPIPKRGEFFANLRKIAKAGKDSAASSGPQK
jgi:hypothetical protein